MTKAKACTRRTLAVGDVALVEQCMCGTVHIAIGAVRFQLPACMVSSLADTVQEAARALEREPSIAALRERNELLS